MHVMILCGISGSGKSTFAKSVSVALKADIVSADHWFTSLDGEYKFNPKELSKAHAACLRDFIALCERSAEEIIVDNTNLSVVELAPYVAISEAFGYSIEIVMFKCDTKTAHERNVHKVPKDALIVQWTRLNHMQKNDMPIRWQRYIRHHE